MNAETTKLYRAVSHAEWSDIQMWGGFRSISSSLQGKWFAETEVDANVWGQRFYGTVGQPFAIVEVEVPDAAANSLFRLPNLDNIGPARFADDAQLVIINQTKTGPIPLITNTLKGKP